MKALTGTTLILAHCEKTANDILKYVLASKKVEYMYSSYGKYKLSIKKATDTTIININAGKCSHKVNTDTELPVHSLSTHFNATFLFA